MALRELMLSMLVWFILLACPREQVRKFMPDFCFEKMFTGLVVQKARPLLHHTMEPGMDQMIYVGMAEPIRKTHTVLTDEKTMAEEIDRVLEAGVKSKLPVYIYVPMDVVQVPLDTSRLEKPLNTKVVNSDAKLEDEVVKGTLELIKKSSKPSILADVLTIRHGGQELARRLAKATSFPTYSTPLSKGLFDETSPKYNGVYNGEGEQSPYQIYSVN